MLLPERGKRSVRCWNSTACTACRTVIGRYVLDSGIMQSVIRVTQRLCSCSMFMLCVCVNKIYSCIIMTLLRRVFYSTNSPSSIAYIFLLFIQWHQIRLLQLATDREATAYISRKTLHCNSVSGSTASFICCSTAIIYYFIFPLHCKTYFCAVFNLWWYLGNLCVV